MRAVKQWVKGNAARKRFALWLMRMAAPWLPPRTLRAPSGYARFLMDLAQFKNVGGKAHTLDWYPCVYDLLPATGFDAQYLYQAAWAARKIHEARPTIHVDVGSELGFVTQLAAFTKIEFIDIRPPAIELTGFSVRKGSITALPYADASIGSISSMHVIEHIGLGRYGDDIDACGPQRACAEIARVLGVGGRAYVSVPIGEPKVSFNSHFTFSASQFATYFSACTVEEFAYVDTDGTFHEEADYRTVTVRGAGASMDFGLGMFLLRKG